MNRNKIGFLLFLLSLLCFVPAQAERTVDHRSFPALKGPFKDGPSVTKACLTCHLQSAHEIMETPHWLWKGEETVVPGSDGKPRRIGKANLINNFCIGIQSNEASCTRCHIGYGWKDKTFDFSDPTRVDCLVCHDTTGEYARPASSDDLGHSSPGGATDWVRVAQGVGPTSVESCGKCHFAGGGGEGVKHGDLDPTLIEAGRGLDLHMGKDGLGFTCSTCHKGEEIPHRITGHSASVAVRTGDALSCAKCHGTSPHGTPFIARTQKERNAGKALRQTGADLSGQHAQRLNWHARRIACQTCHIPRYAREMPTKTWWDWSKAGRLDEEGKSVTELNDDGDIVYMGIKGEFKWGANLVPEYRWYDGTHQRYLLGEKFDPSRILSLNLPRGGPESGAKIWPFKIMRGRQIYDVNNRYLIQPKLSGAKGSGAYWKDFNWDVAAREGMAYAGLDYSGHFDFVETEMHWPLSHMNVEGQGALACQDCHAKTGRLAGVPGVYIPGQSRSRLLDFLGWFVVIGSTFMVLIHGVLRWRSRRRKPVRISEKQS
ncbi:MAG: cytochrome C [Elusimicrobia bacterium]|nr:cytochrome C [Elusimicrobiota bacterium]